VSRLEDGQKLLKIKCYYVHIRYYARNLCMIRAKVFFCAALITSASFFYNTKVTAETCVPPVGGKWELPACFWNAVQRYNTRRQLRVGYKAPYNYAQAIYPGQAPIKCTINYQHPYQFIYKTSCADEYKYEIGTTSCYIDDPNPNCDKAIVISPSGQKTYHTHTWEKGEVVARHKELSKYF